MKWNSLDLAQLLFSLEFDIVLGKRLWMQEISIGFWLKIKLYFRDTDNKTEKKKTHTHII